jgi:hypothetical protein
MANEQSRTERGKAATKEEKKFYHRERRGHKVGGRSRPALIGIGNLTAKLVLSGREGIEAAQSTPKRNQKFSRKDAKLKTEIFPPWRLSDPSIKLRTCLARACPCLEDVWSNE